MSTHCVNVVPIILEPHPNADSLSVVRVGGFTVVVKTEEWKDQKLAIYVEPDMIVPDEPEFDFLAGKRRIKSRRFRGVWSMGLLITLADAKAIVERRTGKPLDLRETANLMEPLGITRYEPPLTAAAFGTIERVADPRVPVAKYDVENWRRYTDAFVEGDTVLVTEKIHGTNARYVFSDGKMHVGSRNWWLKEHETNLYWRVLRQYPQLEDFCKAHPGCVVFGEIYGDVQELQYGHKSGEVSFVAFDLLKANGAFMDASNSRDAFLRWRVPVPPGWYMTWPIDVDAESNGKSSMPLTDHMKEGIVVKPYAERWRMDMGRVIVKIVSDEYLSKSKGR